LNPQYAEACNNLGEALSGKGAVKEAIAQFEKAVQLDPEYAVAHGNLGMLLARTMRTDKAIVHLRKVVEIKPDAVEARRNLGHALAEKGRPQEARVELVAAVRLSAGGDPLALHLLGRVEADLGNLPEAIQTDRRALELATEQHNSRLAQAIDAHLSELLQRQ
jgi:tetratricopeptide (TPR) repeat protein